MPWKTECFPKYPFGCMCVLIQEKKEHTLIPFFSLLPTTKPGRAVLRLHWRFRCIMCALQLQAKTSTLRTLENEVLHFARKQLFSSVGDTDKWNNVQQFTKTTAKEFYLGNVPIVEAGIIAKSAQLKGNFAQANGAGSSRLKVQVHCCCIFSNINYYSANGTVQIMGSILKHFLSPFLFTILLMFRLFHKADHINLTMQCFSISFSWSITYSILCMQRGMHLPIAG